MSILEVHDLKKVYTSRFGTQQVEALRRVNFSVERGEYVAVMGESGSGKTTLLNLLAALDRPTSGSVLLDGTDTASLPEKEVAAFRRDHLGFVFQDFNLLDTFTLEDNIYLPLVLAGKSHAEMEKKLLPLAMDLGIADLLKKYPYEVSGELLSLFAQVNRAGQTIVMVTHSVKAASHATRVLFIRDGEVYHQIYRGNDTNEQLYQKISDTLTVLATGGELK